MLIQSEIPAEIDLRDGVVLEDSRKDYGRTEGANNIPAFLRNTIAVAAHRDSNKNVARAFGISKQEVSLIKNAKVPDGKDEYGKDRVNPNSEINQGIKEAVESDLLQVRVIATKKLLLALGNMTDDRIKLIPKMSEVAHVADTLSRIVERTIPKVDPAAAEAAKFIFIIPENRRSMSDYEIVTVDQPLTD